MADMPHIKFPASVAVVVKFSHLWRNWHIELTYIWGEHWISISNKDNKLQFYRTKQHNKILVPLSDLTNLSRISVWSYDCCKIILFNFNVKFVGIIAYLYFYEYVL
jgi:hypothetical protein